MTDVVFFCGNSSGATLSRSKIHRQSDALSGKSAHDTAKQLRIANNKWQRKL